MDYSHLEVMFPSGASRTESAMSILHIPKAAAALVSAFSMLPASPALAAIHAEPANALSLPTWAIHISSTVEWATAMYLFWRYADVTGRRHSIDLHSRSCFLSYESLLLIACMSVQQHQDANRQALNLCMLAFA